MNAVFACSIEDYLTIMEEAVILGKERGKKTGDNLEKEFFEVAKKKNLMPQFLGKTEQDIDLIAGNLREDGLKILNMREQQGGRNENRKSD